MRARQQESGTIWATRIRTVNLHHVPPYHADHLAYFNPGDLGFLVGLNVLANVPPDDRHLVASGVVIAFKGIWRDSWRPRLEYILYNALAALLDSRDSTLFGVNRMLTDEEYHAWLSENMLPEKDACLKRTGLLVPLLLRAFH
jgi:hypothetical protein